ncbi:2-oxoglutarate and iron-dependent oxygenase domain-containing protein [Mycobacterium sp. OTB74]|uniref:2-oxoglutarate and iron-dependent oxygenase domain-containing protein n=1 Tax=Mycobacterium sp. OTB74 TaxID=1853452 RepID=UPI0024752942|nr:2-oxoglutarate and iron-dependent oxygenase domain-containing protein [Mycobacterium sp. OTB74]
MVVQRGLPDADRRSNAAGRGPAVTGGGEQFACRVEDFVTVGLSGTGVEDALFDRLLTATRDFFALPLEQKMRSYIGLSDCHRGYVSIGEEGVAEGNPDLKEAFDSALDLPADDPDHLAGNPMLGLNSWPDLPGFADAAIDYYNGVLAVGHQLLWAFAVALGEDPETFTRAVPSGPWPNPMNCTGNVIARTRSVGPRGPTTGIARGIPRQCSMNWLC